VSSIDLTHVSDYDEPRRRVRLRASTTKTRKALWVELHPVLADAVDDRSGRARIATLMRGCSLAAVPTRCVPRSRKRAGLRASRCFHRTICGTGGFR